jgi:hypothetical protein
LTSRIFQLQRSDISFDEKPANPDSRLTTFDVRHIREAEHVGDVRAKFAEDEGREAERRGRRESLGQGQGELLRTGA